MPVQLTHQQISREPIHLKKKYACDLKSRISKILKKIVPKCFRKKKKTERDKKREKRSKKENVSGNTSTTTTRLSLVTRDNAFVVCGQQVPV